MGKVLDREVAISARWGDAVSSAARRERRGQQHGDAAQVSGSSSDWPMTFMARCWAACSWLRTSGARGTHPNKNPNKRGMLMHDWPDEGIAYATTTVCVKYVSCSLEETRELIGPGSSFKDELYERKLAVDSI